MSTRGTAWRFPDSRWWTVFGVWIALAANAHAAIAYVAASSQTSVSSSMSSISWTHALGNPSNSKRLVVVGIETETATSANQVINSVTFNGTNMTAVTSGTASNGINRIDMYYILDANLPSSTGNYTVQVNFAGSMTQIVAGAVELSGVAQAAPEAVSSSTASSASSISTSITTLSANAMVVSMFGAGDGFDVSGIDGSTSNSTERWERRSNSSLGAMSTLATTTAGSKTVTWTTTPTSNRYVQLLASFAEATATLSGTVFEDVTYAGGSGRSLATSSGSVRSGARVELYNASDTLVTTATTNGSGAYSFAGLSLGTTYKVRVVNSTVTSSLGGTGLIPVQTYRTTATTGSAVAVTDRVGGEDPTKADQGNGTTTLPATTGTLTVQSITSATIDFNDITGLDFGFNFNTIVNTGDTGQGTLRQVVTNANAMSGTQTTQFMISGGSAVNGLRAGLTNQLTSGVALITLATILPDVSGTLILDGTTQTTNVGNTNSGTLGTGGTVGVDALTLSTVNRPEIEIVGTSTIANGFEFLATTTGSTIKGIAIHGFGDIANSTDADITVRSDNTTITQNFFGISATSYSTPSAITGRISMRIVGCANGTFTNNLLGYGGHNGLALRSNTSGWLVENNEFRGFGTLRTNGDAISISETASATIRGNLIAGNLYNGIDFTQSTASGSTVVNNTISGNTVGASASELAAVRVLSSNNTLDRNIITQNYGAGVMISNTGTGNKITQNAISLNGTITNNSAAVATGALGIDLVSSSESANSITSPYYTLNDNGDADTGGNNLFNFPIVDSATIIGSNLELTGWAPTGATLEFFVSDNDATGFGEGQTFFASYTEGGGSDTDATTSNYSGNINCLAQGTGTSVARFKFTIAKPSSVSLNAKVTATATDASNNTSEFSGQVTVRDGPDFTIVKSSQTLSDPINSTTNPKAIPGAIVQYSLLITNTDGSRGDNNSFILTDPIPTTAELYVSDLGSAGSGPISFTDGSTSSGLTYTFTSLASTTDDISFSNDNGSTWTYVPTPDANGCDSAVTNIRINPKGTFARSECGNNPSCTFRFRVRVK
jgi:parallel beta-helix repeat protein